MLSPSSMLPDDHLVRCFQAWGHRSWTPEWSMLRACACSSRIQGCICFRCGLVRSSSSLELQSVREASCHHWSSIADALTRVPQVYRASQCAVLGTESTATPQQPPLQLTQGSSVQFTALLKTKLVEDLLFLFDEEQSVAHLVIKLGRDVCGHAQIMHGGLTSSIFDETFGALVYVMKQRRLLTADLAVTANLNLNYRKVRPPFLSAPHPHATSIVSAPPIVNIQLLFLCQLTWF